MKVTIIPVTPFEQNSTLLVCEQTQMAAVVDPGGDLDRIEGEITKLGAKLEKVFLTHGHIDHCGEARVLADRHGVPLEGPHEDDRFWIEQLPYQSQMFGFPPLQAFDSDRWLKGGDTVGFGKVVLEVRHCPGHTPGHVIFFHRPSRLAIVGDVLFAGSIGRTDFPRGDYNTLVKSIRSQLFALCDEIGEDIAFVPGHGPMSTFLKERRDNPFVADKRYG